MLKRFINETVELLYPPLCYFCNASVSNDRYICDSCSLAMPKVEAPYCKVCGEPFDGVVYSDLHCSNCQDREVLYDFAVASLRFSKNSREVIHGLKYQKRKFLLPHLVSKMVEKFLEEERFSEIDDWVVCPVPMHWRRTFKRGFNQAEELGFMLSKELELSYRKLLKRQVYTIFQATLNRERRLKNLNGSLSLNSAFKGELPSSILLVDDVLTTGATADACARILKSSPNVERVAVLTYMRG